MPRERDAYLWDALGAIDWIRRALDGESWDDYQRNDVLRFAVERQLITIGEALNQLSKHFPASAAQVTEVPSIVAFRNHIVHGYATLDDEVVWASATEELHSLAEELRSLLGT